MPADGSREQVERILKKTFLAMLADRTGFDLSACQLPILSDNDRLILRCPEEVALNLKSRLISDGEFAEGFVNSANFLYQARSIFLQTVEKEAVYLFTPGGVERANSLKRKQGKMIDSKPKASILPQTDDQVALFSAILWSPKLLTLVSEETQQPVVVSSGYVEWTGRSLLEWLSPNSGNERRWANGELIRMQELLTQEPDQVLREYRYTAGYCKDGDRPYTFETSFQRVEIPGAGWFRFAEVHGATPATVYQ